MDSDTAAVSAKPAAYGQSCNNCVRAKCRCMIRNANDGCERCHRLRKECRPSPTIRKRNTKRSTAPRSAWLKANVDSVISPLNENQNDPEPLILQNLTPTNPGGPAALGKTACGIDDSSVTATSATGPNSASLHQSPALSSCHDLSDVESSSFEAEDALNRFRNFSATQYPFIYIAPDISARELETNRPFLWLCIKAVSCLPSSTQKALGFRVSEIIAQRMLIENERSVDLLLGLLVYIGRANPLMQDHRPYFSLFTQMAQVVVFDLGLNKPIQTESVNVPTCDPKDSNQNGPNVPGAPNPSSMQIRTMEERRAVLGCYYITSIIAAYGQRIDGLCWTSHMAQSLQMLTEKSECSQDTVLVLLVRTRLIADKMTQLSRNDNSSKTSPPPVFFMRALDAELQEIQRNISNGTERTVLYASQLSIHHTQLVIWDSALVNGSSLADMLTTDPSRLEGLYKCLEATKTWFDLAFKLSATNYAFPLLSPLTDFISALHKLSTVQVSGWSVELVRQTLYLPQVLQNLAQNFEQAKSQTRMAGDFLAGDIYENGVTFMKYMKNMVESRSTEVFTRGSRAEGVATQETGPGYRDQNDEAVMFSIDYSDDPWLTELLATVQY